MVLAMVAKMRICCCEDAERLELALAVWWRLLGLDGVVLVGWGCVGCYTLCYDSHVDSEICK